MNDTFFSLLRNQKFFPLFLTQFFGAFTDNLFRSSLLIFVTYNEALSQGYPTQLIATFIGGIVILPFFLFSSLAGQLADKYDKARIVRVIKSIEILIMAWAIYGFATSSLFIMLTSLFLTLTQSAFFGPIKYSLVPTYLPKEQVMSGNALIESSTFIGILLGTILGATFITFSKVILSVLLMFSTVLGLFFSFKLPETTPADANLKISRNQYNETLSLIKHAAKDRVLFMSIIGISWFWVVGGVMLTQIGTYGKEVIGVNQSVATVFMVLFTLGIGLGSYLCSKWMKGEIDAHLVPWGAIGTTLFLLDFVIVSNALSLTGPENIGVEQFFSQTTNWRICFDLLMIAVCAGICMVPLYSILQTQADEKECSRMIAANNIMNSFFMVLSSLVTAALISLNVTILNIFLIVSILNLFAMHKLSSIVPESILQLVLQALFKTFYKVEVRGLDNFKNAGDRVLIIANHTSFIDSILIFAFIPDKLNFAIYSQYINHWWIKMISSGINLFPVDPTNPMATKSLIEYLRKDKKCVIFPEGRISVTGSLMKIYDGPGMIADHAKANILPIRIDGAEYSLFSRLKGKVRRRPFPKITVTILPPQRIEVDPALRGRERRRIISHKVYDLMVQMLFDTSAYNETLGRSLIDAAKLHGMRREIAEDMQRQPITYRQLLMRSFILGDLLSQKVGEGENVGVLLPTSIASLVSFFGLTFHNRVPAMLNFSLGAKTLVDTCSLARIRIVITSRKFVELARLQNTIDQLSKYTDIIFLEDFRESISLVDKLKGVAASFFPNTAFKKYEKNMTPDQPAVILFTSGSEGTPKAVALSHRNLNANRHQVNAVVDFAAQDIILNALPMFHSFGLTGGTLIPVLSGVRSFLYPSPLHYRIIPVIAYEVNASIFFATDTFLSRYAQSAHSYDFYSTRFVFAGAEKLREETRRLWMDKFGLQVLEAYGTTETAPALTINTRMNNKTGTVGKFVPGIEYRLKKVPGIEEGGLLLVKGPNIMLGYISSETGKIAPTSAELEANGELTEGWYNTGDIVKVDDQGYVTILGRAKRFAKIGGEMVSLVAIEEHLNRLLPEHHHVIVTRPDSRKGEKLILLTTSAISKDEVRVSLQNIGLGEIMIPRIVHTVEAIPLLATGKIDFQGVTKLADSVLGATVH